MPSPRTTDAADRADDGLPPAEDPSTNEELGQVLFAGSATPVVCRSARVSGTVEVVSLDDGRVVRSWPARAANESGGSCGAGTVSGEPVATGRYALRFAGQATAAQAGVTDAFTVYDAMYRTWDLSDQTAWGRPGTPEPGRLRLLRTPLITVRGRSQARRGASGRQLRRHRTCGRTVRRLDAHEQALHASHRRHGGTAQIVGKVGETGCATGCHRQFEQWTAPGRYLSGRAMHRRPTSVAEVAEADVAPITGHPPHVNRRALS